MSNPNQPPYGGQYPKFNPSQSPYGGQAPRPQFPPQQPPTPVRKRRWYFSSPVVGGAAWIFGIILGAASASGSATSASPGAVRTVQVPGPTVTATSEQTVTATRTVTAKPKPAPTRTVTVTAKPKLKHRDGGSTGTIGDGTYVVGSEIAIGNYKSSGGASDLCYADTETESGDILDQQVSQGAPVVIRITSQAYTFESDGCGTWTKIG